MSSFQIYQDDDDDEETSSSNIPTRAKKANQPLGWRNTNSIVQNQYGNVPARFLKKDHVSRGVEIRKWDTNVDKAEKKNQLLAVTQQLEAISIPEKKHGVDLNDTSMFPFSALIVNRSMMERLRSENERLMEHREFVNARDAMPFDKVEENHDDSINAADISMSSDCQRNNSDLLDSSPMSEDCSMMEKLSSDSEESYERYQEDSINVADISMLSDTGFSEEHQEDSINAEDTSMISDYVEDSINEEDTSMISYDTFEINQEESIYTKDTAMYSDRQRAYEGVQQYQKDILATCRESELRQRPKAHYMFRQEDINYAMRSVLIDWLLAVAEEYQLTTETLYLSVAYLDRYLGKVLATRSNFQLVGITALFVASKYEEFNHPRVREFIFITYNSYSRQELLSEEKLMLKVLSFDLMTPTAFAFINMYALMCEDMTNRLKFLTLYISELSLVNGEPFLLSLPSQISAAALALARYTLGMEMWSPQLEELTTYKIKNLRTIILALSHTLSTAKQLETMNIHTKYSGDKYDNVADIEVKGLTKLQFAE